jgi:hypothetical protein
MRLLLVLTVVACGSPCEHYKTVYSAGDSEESKACFRDCIKGTVRSRTSDCEALCPEANPTVICE